MQLGFTDTFIRQRKIAARIEGIALLELTSYVDTLAEGLMLDPRSGELHQLDDGVVTRSFHIDGTKLVLLYALENSELLRLRGVVEASALENLRTREELLVPKELEPYADALRDIDDSLLEQRRIHWVGRRTLIERGGLGNGPEHRTSLLRMCALFAEAVDAELSRRSRGE